MEQKYPPGSQKFERSSDVEDKMRFTSASVGWANVLAGKALTAFHDKMIPAFLRKKK
jgi:hypothetical protein